MKSTNRVAVLLLAGSALLGACGPTEIYDEGLEPVSDSDFESVALALSSGKADSNDDSKSKKKKIKKRFLKLLENGDLKPQDDPKDATTGAAAPLTLTTGNVWHNHIEKPAGLHRYQFKIDKDQEVLLRFETPKKHFLPVLMVRAKTATSGDETASTNTWIAIKSRKQEDEWEGRKDARVLMLKWKSPDGADYEVLLTSRENLSDKKAKTKADYTLQACIKGDNGLFTCPNEIDAGGDKKKDDTKKDDTKKDDSKQD